MLIGIFFKSFWLSNLKKFLNKYVKNPIWSDLPSFCYLFLLYRFLSSIVFFCLFFFLFFFLFHFNAFHIVRPFGVYAHHHEMRNFYLTFSFKIKFSLRKTNNFYCMQKWSNNIHFVYIYRFCFFIASVSSSIITFFSVCGPNM